MPEKPFRVVVSSGKQWITVVFKRIVTLIILKNLKYGWAEIVQHYKATPK